jgi:hypothetical protein
MNDFGEFIELGVLYKILPILGAIIIVLIGMFVAKKLAESLGKLLSKVKGFDFLKHKVFQCEDGHERILLGLIVKFIYYIIVIFTVVAAAERLGLTKFTSPLNSFLESIFLYVPNILGGLIFLLIAFVLAKLAGYFTMTLLSKVKIEERLKLGEGTSLTKALSDLVYIIVFVLLLPGVLSALRLDSILSPITNMLDKFLLFIPNIVAAGLILAIRWFIAFKIRDAVREILESLNVEEKLVISERKIFEGKLSSILSNIVYILILIPVFTASLSYIGLGYITQPVVDTIGIVFSYLPNLVGALIILSVAFFFSQILEKVVTNLLSGFGFDKHLGKLGLKSEEGCYSKVAGKVVKYILIYFALLQSIEILGFTVLTDLSYNLTVLLGSILMGVFIIAIGVFVANFVAGFVASTNIRNKKFIATVARIAVLVFVGAMGLRQMGIANEIINMAFGFTLGAIAVALAIAFGFGGRDIAAKKLEEFEKCLKEEKKEE